MSKKLISTMFLLSIIIFVFGDVYYVAPFGDNIDNGESIQCIDGGDPTSALDPDNTLADIGCYYFDHDYDIKRFETGIHWVSFPYLENQGYSYNADDTNGETFEQAYYENGLPGLLQTSPGGFPPINDFTNIEGYRDGNRTEIEYIVESYSFNENGFDNMLFRHEGYKIIIEEGAELTILPVDGERLENYEIENMEAGKEYWLGYYLLRPQKISDAFGNGAGAGNNFWSDVNNVWAEDWFYHNYSDYRNDSAIEFPSNKTSDKVLEYGKMYIVEMRYDVQNFKWFDSFNAQRKETTTIPENFDFVKKTDYEAIDILGIPDDVIEIGVYEGDKCVGAVSVKDSTAQVLVYSSEANRAEIPFSFELISGRGDSKKVKKYAVLDKYSQIFSDGVIISGRQNYSVLRLNIKDNGESETPSPIIFGNYPNPFNPTTTLSFLLPSKEEIELTVFNIKGQKIKTLFKGIGKEGENKFTWNGTDINETPVSSGVYFYQLSNSTTTSTSKMLLLK